MNRISYFCFVIIIYLASAINAFTQFTSSIPENKTMFTGHTKTADIAVKEASDIVVASFTKLGFPGSDADGENFYEQAEISVASALKGNLSGQLKVSYSVQSMPGRDRETAPVIGTRYIMFIQKLGPKEYEIRKLLPATEENIASVKALLTSQSKH